MDNGFLEKMITNNTPGQSILVYFAIYLYFLKKIILFEEIYDHDQKCLCKNVVFVNINSIVEVVFYYTNLKFYRQQVKRHEIMSQFFLSNPFITVFLVLGKTNVRIFKDYLGRIELMIL